MGNTAMAGRRSFHASSDKALAGGTCIKPGNFGRRVRQFGPKGRAFGNYNDAKNTAWETGLEAYRRMLLPEAPSRLECVFCCPSRTDAQRFLNEILKNNGAVYEVEFDPETKTYVGNYDLITMPSELPLVDHWLDRCQKYWTTPLPDEKCLREMLVGGDVTIVRTV
jgi:hypothetical protein